MTKQNAITEHTRLVLHRRMHTKLPTSSYNPDYVAALDREISRLGQAHNPKISAKALSALGGLQ